MPQAPAMRDTSESSNVAKLVTLHHRRRGWAWVAVGSLIGLAVRLYLGGAGTPRAEPKAPPRAGVHRGEILFCLAVFAVLCVAVLRVAPVLVEPDDHAYLASIIGITDGHLLTLSNAQTQALANQVQTLSGRPFLIQWTQLANGRWISQKNPGYPFLAVPFQLLGIIRLAPLWYGLLGCIGMFLGARRWLGRFGGAAAVGLYCSSGAAIQFAWRDYMPTFTDASLIAAGTGLLLWAVLAADASLRRRTWAGVVAFAALGAATFTRYTDIVVLGCAVLAVIVAWRLRQVPAQALAWWLGTVVLCCAGIAVFNDLVYGGPLNSVYPPGLIKFSLSAIPQNLRYMPAHLIDAMPMLVLGLAGLAWIIVQAVRQRRAGAGPNSATRRDLTVGLAGGVLGHRVGPLRRLHLDCGPRPAHAVSSAVLCPGTGRHRAARCLAHHPAAPPGVAAGGVLRGPSGADAFHGPVVLPRHDPACAPAPPTASPSPSQSSAGPYSAGPNRCAWSWRAGRSVAVRGRWRPVVLTCVLKETLARGPRPGSTLGARASSPSAGGRVLRRRR